MAEQLGDPAEIQDISLNDFGPATDFTTHSGTGKIAQADVPWEFRIPDELSRESSVIIAPGYFAKQEVYDNLADVLASHGVATATYRAIRRQGKLAGWHPKHFSHPERLVCQAPWAVIRDIRKKHGKEAPTDQFTYAGHSMGGRTAVMNGLTHPETVDGVVMIDAAGLEDQTLGQMLGRLPGFFTGEVVPTMLSRELSLKSKIELTYNSVLYAAQNPMRTAAEGISIAKADIRPFIPNLANHHIPSAIVVSNADRLVNAANVVAQAGHLPDYLHVMHDPNLGHLGPLRQAEKYGAALLQLMQAFDRERQATSQDQAPDLKLAA